MTVARDVLETRVKVTYDYGTDPKGKAITKTKAFAHIKSASTDQQIFDVVAALTGLQDLTTLAITREDNAGLSEA